MQPKASYMPEDFMLEHFLGLVTSERQVEILSIELSVHLDSYECLNIICEGASWVLAG
jgi:hypothetical protein